MFRNYLTAAIRHIGRNRFASTINIISLAIGLTAALLVMLFVRHELSYDRWIPNADQIYRYDTEIVDAGGNPVYMPRGPAGALDVMMARFPEIEKATRFSFGEHSLHRDDQVHYEFMIFAEENFFDVLDIPLIEGDRETALSGVTSVLLSQEKALKYFGGQSPLGQTLSVEEDSGGEKRDFLVTGVFRNIPLNSHLDIDFILSNQPNDEGYGFQIDSPWHRLNAYTYLQLAAGTNPGLIEASFPAMLDDHVDGTRYEDGRSGSDAYHPYLIPLTDIHMNQNNADPMRPLGERGLLYALMGIALLILVIASINFMNLELARSLTRAREVSIRKVHGAGRRQLMTQYLGETFILTLLALGLALAAAALVLPYLNAFVDKDLALNNLLTGEMIIALLLLLGTVSLFAGLYPAFVLSSFRPAAIFRSARGQGGTHRLRNALVVFQFTVSIALGIGATVIQSQRHYTATHDLGFATADKLIIRWMNWGHFAEKSPLIRERIQAHPDVIGTAYSDVVPGDPMFGYIPITLPGYTGDEPIQARAMNVDDGFFDVYGVELVAGRFFSRDFGEDYLQVNDGGEEEGQGEQDAPQIQQFSTLLNESAVRQIGFESAEAALGATFGVGESGLRPTVVGVVRDFHFSSLREEIGPVTYYMASERFANLTVRVRRGADMSAVVRDITAIWHDSIPRDPITLEYLDENIAALYGKDRRQGLMVSTLAALALLVACMGLYGLSALTAAEKSREVSIRKVHGASIPAIISLLLWRLSNPVFLAIVLAWPLAWYGARQYLDAFSYRIDLGAGFFIGAGISALIISSLTVGGHAVKVARTNPIHALRERE
jgi:putative ABC transport system permease protein